MPLGLDRQNYSWRESFHSRLGIWFEAPGGSLGFWLDIAPSMHRFVSAVGANAWLAGYAPNQLHESAVEYGAVFLSVLPMMPERVCTRTADESSVFHLKLLAGHLGVLRTASGFTLKNPSAPLHG